MIEQHSAFFTDLSVILSVAAVSAIIFHRFRLPVVLGYIFAGFIIGPHFTSLGIISSKENIHAISELGVVFLLFSLGLEFNLNRLKGVGVAAFLAGAVEIGGMLVIGNMFGRVMGWDQGESMFLGAILAISSTTIIIKVLSDMNLKKEAFAEMIFGMLIVEDLAAILIITLLSGATAGQSLFSMSSLPTLAYLLVFLTSSLVVGLLVIPKITNIVASYKNDELLLMLSLGLCLGFCMVVAALGYSLALGAFIMGAILGSTKAVWRIENIIAPIRDLFCAVFFVSVGLMIQPSTIASHPGTVGIIFLLLIMGKSILCSLGAFIAGRDFTSSLKVGMGMAQIGEFSFVIAALGVSNGVIDESLFSIVISVSILTTITTPLFIRFSEPFAHFILRRAPAILLSYIDLYYKWNTRFRERSHSHAVQNILKNISFKLVIFIMLIASAFLIALFLARVLPTIFPIPPKFIPWLETALWLTAVLGSMPIILPLIKKMKAFGMILAELGITENLGGSQYQNLRTILANIFLLIGFGVLILYGGILSAAILPTWNLLFLLAAIVGLLVYFFKDAFNNIYIQGIHTLSQNLSPEDIEEEDKAILLKKDEKIPGRIQELHTIQNIIQKGSALDGCSIQNTDLGKDTGAFIVAIDRDSGTIVRPSGEEELMEGDVILLMGSLTQLANARPLFELEDHTISPDGNTPK
ncbi:MAG: cation:proton antiporter [Fibrobacteria bacterium]|nr:cation:proton antiporter [Fibrobacteria bacterium]